MTHSFPLSRRVYQPVWVQHPDGRLRRANLSLNVPEGFEPGDIQMIKGYVEVPGLATPIELPLSDAWKKGYALSERYYRKE